MDSTRTPEPEPIPFAAEAKRLAKRPSLRTLAIFYWARFRAGPVRELLALMGIAAGVAMLLAVQTANKSVTGSFDEFAKGITGKASLEIAARSPDGFDQDFLRRATRLRFVKGAAPLIERRIAVRGPKGRAPLTLYGTDNRLLRIGGPLVRQLARKNGEDASPGLYVSAAAADAAGVKVGDNVAVEAGERIVRVPLAGIFDAHQAGSLSQTPAAVAPLGQVQEIAGMPHRVTRILIAPQPGKEAAVKKSIAKLSPDGALNVRPVTTEADLLHQLTTADRQITTLQSAIGLVVGLLLAYNVMLLTIAERRPLIATLRKIGATRRAVAASLMFDALVLGLAGSVAGAFLGAQLSHFLHATTPYLTASFAIGEQRIVTFESVVIAMTGGVVAALAAAAGPAIALLRVGPLDGLSDAGVSAPRAGPSRTTIHLSRGGLAVIVLATSLAVLVPMTASVDVAVLAFGVLMILPRLVGRMVSLAESVARRHGGAISNLAVAEISSTPNRATALAAIGALAVYAILSVSGPVLDVHRGISQLTNEMFKNADVWVKPGGLDNVWLTLPFDSRDLAKRLRRLATISAVREQRGSYLDLANRRVVVGGAPPGAKYPIAPSQLVEGNLQLAQHRLRRGGWAALTSTIAAERNINIGDRFNVPTPTGSRSFRLAGRITSYGWPSGMLIMNSRDFGNAWGSSHVSALALDVAPGVSASRAVRDVRAQLGPSSSLQVQTAAAAASEGKRLDREDLARFQQISDMMFVAAILAIAAGMLAAIWQRRRQLTALRALGLGAAQLYRALAAETAAILAFGCLLGAGFGFLGQAISGLWVRVSVGHPVPYVPAVGLALKVIVLATLLAALATAVVARFSLRFDPHATFSPE